MASPILSHCVNVRHCLPDGIIRMLVTALVISRIQYCLTVYGNGSQKNFDRLQKILNFAARVIFGRRKFDHVSDLRKKLGWLSPRCMSDHQTLVIAHKAIQRGEPEVLAALFVTNSAIRERQSRQDHLVSSSATAAGNGQATVRLSSRCSAQQSPISTVAAASCSLRPFRQSRDCGRVIRASSLTN